MTGWPFTLLPRFCCVCDICLYNDTDRAKRQLHLNTRVTALLQTLQSVHAGVGGAPALWQVSVNQRCACRGATADFFFFFFLSLCQTIRSVLQTSLKTWFVSRTKCPPSHAALPEYHQSAWCGTDTMGTPVGVQWEFFF